MLAAVQPSLKRRACAFFHPRNFLRVLYRSFCNVSTHPPSVYRKTGEFCRVKGFVISQVLRFDAPQKRPFLFLNIFGVFHRACDGEIVFSRRWRSPPHAGRFCRTRRLHNKKTKGVFRLPEHSENASRLSDQGEKTIRFTLEKKQIKNIIFRCAGTSRRRYACRF